MPNLRRVAEYLRTPTVFSKENPPAVDREARIITGYAVATKGVALGHGAWLDSDFLDQVVEFGNMKPIKCRYTHPGLSSDGMGTQIGNAMNFRRDGDVVRADLHFHKQVTSQRRADMIADVMDLAEEDPKAFGSSIVFERDPDLEQAYWEKHSIKQGRDSVFISPDKANTDNLPHWRLAALRASDVVDQPAANPGGFLSEGEEMASRAEAILSYTFGIVAQAPEALESSGIPPLKFKTFVAGFLQRHGLQVVKADCQPDEEMPDEEMQTCPECGHEFKGKTKKCSAQVHASEDGDGDPVSDPAASPATDAPAAPESPAAPVADPPVDAPPAEAPADPPANPGTEQPSADAPTDPDATQPAPIAASQAGVLRYEQAHPSGTDMAAGTEAWDLQEEIAAASTEDLAAMAAWCEPGGDSIKGSYKLLHHRAASGHAVVWRGLAAAAARLPILDIPEEAKAEIQESHLSRHYRELDEAPPWSRDASGWVAYGALCKQLKLRGGITDADLAERLRVCGFTAEADAICAAPAVIVPSGVPEEVTEGDGEFSLEDLLTAFSTRIDERLTEVTGRLPG